MTEPDESMQELELLSETEGPAACEPLVVERFRREACDSSERAARIEHVHQIHEADIPRASLLADRFFERERCSTMAAARVEVDEVDRLHRPRIITASHDRRVTGSYAASKILPGLSIPFGSNAFFRVRMRSISALDLESER